MAYDIKSINETAKFDGLFSEYLPPCFQIKKEPYDIFKSPPPEDCDLIEPMVYTMSRLLNEFILTDQQKDSICNLAQSWILLYELYLKDMIKDDKFYSKLEINKSKPFYTRLKNNNFSFYHSIVEPEKTPSEL